MSHPLASTHPIHPTVSSAQSHLAPSVLWADPTRENAFGAWLAPLIALHQLLPATLRVASQDASFRRYLRIDSAAGGSCVVMDAPPEQQNCRAFVHVQSLMAQAGLNVPQILAWDEAAGFMLLSDLGEHTVLALLDPQEPQKAHSWYLQAVDTLLQWQQASKVGTLPAYDEAVLRRELALFPDWYLAKHRGAVLTDKQHTTLASAFNAIVAHNLAAPMVYVHRDFMMRNLMAPTLGTGVSSLPPEGALTALGRSGGGSMAPTLGAGVSSPSPEAALPALGRPSGSVTPVPGAATSSLPAERGPLGVLDFQDAVYGPITYDIASLLRDAFISWDEEFVIDVTVRYWEKARNAGLLGAASASGWGSDFGEFYRGVEWMGLQRHLKVAGLFARLSLRDGKPKYLADTPRFMGYIRATANRYRQLGPLLQMLDSIEGTQPATGFAYGRV